MSWFSFRYFPGSPLRCWELESLQDEALIYISKTVPSWNAAGPWIPDSYWRIASLRASPEKNALRCLSNTSCAPTLCKLPCSGCAAAQDREKYKGAMYSLIRQKQFTFIQRLPHRRQFPQHFTHISWNDPHSNLRIWRLLFSFSHRQGNRGFKEVKELGSVTQVAGGRSEI